ncbi:MAG: CPBP family intramembrane metalloprotease [Planctomycetes bacterium]|nr:CPBP family intramembrane metalloprotease [Planctomycetota bacterium]
MSDSPSLAPPPIRASRAIRLYLGLRLRRFSNLFLSGFRGRAKKKDAPAKRQASPGKRGMGWVLPVALGLLSILQSIFIAHNIVTGIVFAIGEAKLAEASALLLTQLFATLILLGFAQRSSDPARLEWDLEWLLTLPVSPRTMLLAKIAEQTVLDFFGWLSVTAFLGCLSWHWGLRWSAPVLALALAVPFVALIGMGRVLLETTLRMCCPPSMLRNIHGMTILLSLVGLMLVMAPMAGMKKPDYFIWAWLNLCGDWCAWIPGGWVVNVAWAMGPGEQAVGASLAVYGGACAVFGMLGWRLLERLTARGFIESTGPLQGTRGLPPPRTGARKPLLSGVAGKDLRLLLRDRTFLVSTLFTPLAIAGMQLVFNPDLLKKGFTDVRHMGAIAFGMGGYVLLFSAVTVLTAEGPALWLLYTFPRRLDLMLRQKALLWGGLASLYTAAILGWGWFTLGPSADLVSESAYALAGLPLFALIAAAFGVFACNPEEKDPRHRLRPDYLYPLMLLEGLYIYGFYANSAWAKITLLVLLSALALALWQKVAAMVPYILDPVSRPPARLTLSDGLIAVVLFFVLQGVFLLLSLALRIPFGAAQFIAFSAAGALTLALTLYTLWRHEVPRLWNTLGLVRGSGWIATPLAGTIWALPALGAGAGYLWLAEHWPWLNYWFELARNDAGAQLPSLGWWIVPLAVVAAPLCEEAIFRGMIYRGMRENFGIWPSVLLSAAVFATVHPPLSFPPVFAMGVCAALAFEHGKSLLAPIYVHALYNAMVLWLQRPV